MLQPKKGLTEAGKAGWLLRDAEQYNRAPVPVHTTEPRGLDDHWHRHYLYDSSSTGVLLYVHTVHLTMTRYQSVLDNDVE